ncbi:uncharacterized protein ACBT57_001741 isoform 1-T1 [Dama dama]
MASRTLENANPQNGARRLAPPFAECLNEMPSSLAALAELCLEQAPPAAHGLPAQSQAWVSTSSGAARRQPCEARAITCVHPRGSGGSENCVHLPVRLDILNEGPASSTGAGGPFGRAPLTRSPPTHFLESSFRNTRPN